MINIKIKAFFSLEDKSLLDKYANTSDLLAIFLESTLEDFVFSLFSLLVLPFVGLELGSTLVDGASDGANEGLPLSLGTDEGVSLGS